MERDYAKYLLEKIRQDYNLIAADFSRTRGRMWPELNFLAGQISEKDRILDLGCGNGRFYRLLPGRTIDYYGVDFSEKLIDIAKKEHPQADFRVADALNLPFSDNFFDKVLCIAVLHHIPSVSFRSRFLAETRRVLKPGGKFFLTVWGLDGRKRAVLLVKYLTAKFLGKNNLDFGDTFIPWGKKITRYVHYFQKRELNGLCHSAGFEVKEIKTVKRPQGRQRNILLTAQKPS